MFSRQSQSILPPRGLIPAEAVTRRDRERRKSYRIARLIRFVTAGESSSSRWKKLTQESLYLLLTKTRVGLWETKQVIPSTPRSDTHSSDVQFHGPELQNKWCFLRGLVRTNPLFSQHRGQRASASGGGSLRISCFFVVLKWMCDEQPSDLKIINNGRSPRWFPTARSGWLQFPNQNQKARQTLSDFHSCIQAALCSVCAGWRSAFSVQMCLCIIIRISHDHKLYNTDFTN